MPCPSSCISFGLVHVSFLGKQYQGDSAKGAKHNTNDRSNTFVARGRIHHGRDRKALDGILTVGSFITSRTNATNVPSVLLGVRIFALQWYDKKTDE
jgi:hypothetical protein